MPDRLIFFLGDVVGKAGRNCLFHWLPLLVKKVQPDAIIVNIENVAGGKGPTLKIMQDLEALPVDVWTTGSHFFDHKDFVQNCHRYPQVLRPDNYPEGNPGKGIYLLTLRDGGYLVVIQLEGRTFMRSLDCPFQRANQLVKVWGEKGPILVDFHAEATSEKTAFGHYLDGRVAAVLGTHTHIPTDDVSILPKGTGYVTEAGMVGGYDGVIGYRKDRVIQKFLLQSPHPFEPSKSKPAMPVIILKVDGKKQCCYGIRRFWFRSLEDVESFNTEQLCDDHPGA